MQEQLDGIEKKLDKMLKLLNPIVEIDKALRADIKKVLSHGKEPRKQPDGNAWKKPREVAGGMRVSEKVAQDG